MPAKKRKPPANDSPKAKPREALPLMFTVPPGSDGLLSNMNTFGSRLAQRREAMGLSLAALARKAEISKTYLWELENDSSRGTPSALVLHNLAVALSTTMDQLWTGTAPDPGDALRYAAATLRAIAEAAGVEVPLALPK
jgi:transcriptional regulator with XRE-family HTH domain